MNFNNQHSSDEIIERELRALREPASSKHGVGDAIRAMQSMPSSSRLSIKWPIGIGSIAVAAGAVIVVGSLTTAKAYAGDLRDIASAQEHQKTMYQKSYIYSGSKEPIRVLETWLDHEKEAMRQFSEEGNLQYATVSDGKLCFRYSAGSPDIDPSATIDVDRSEHFGIETIMSYLQSDFFQKHAIEKTSGVKLNGKTCDLYNFAKGYYRVWVDPVTKLPLQREVYDKGVTLWERDVYEYPAEFSSETFKAPNIPGMTYFDYPAARIRLEKSLAAPGTTQTVGGVKVTLKAIVKDGQSLTVLFKSTGDQGKFNDVRRLPLPNVRFFTDNFRDDQITIAKPAGLKNERMFFKSDSSLKNLETIKLGVWVKDKFVGYAEFPYKNVIEAPYAGTLLLRPVAEPGQVAKAANTKQQ